MLTQRVNDKTGRREYCLVSRGSGDVLQWFGVQKPSPGMVAKVEARINYFKHGGKDHAHGGPARSKFHK